jgi:hypothetical protein
MRFIWLGTEKKTALTLLRAEDANILAGRPGALRIFADVDAAGAALG